jgi:hypothetical protein
VKKLFALLTLLTFGTSFSKEHDGNPYWSDYRYEHRLGFEAEGYTLFGWNHETRTLVKITNKSKRIVTLNYVEVHPDHYTIEVMKIDCKKKTSISTDQYESWNGGPEKHYLVDGGWEPIPTFVGVGEFGQTQTDLHYSLYKDVCKSH